MIEEQDLTKPIVDPILLLVEGSGRLPASANDVAPVDSLEEFDRVCTIDVRGLLSNSDRDKIDKDRRLKSIEDQQEEKSEVVKKQKQTVLTRIKDQWSSGPISILHRALTQRLRVKVWIRNHTAVRSILVGFVAAFDKHLNMALVDVDEVTLLRPATIKCTTLAPAEELAKLEVRHNEQDLLARANSKMYEQIESDFADAGSAARLNSLGASGTSAAAATPKDLAGADLTTKSDGGGGACANPEQVATRAERGSSAAKLSKPSQKKRRLRQDLLKTSDSQRFVAQLFVRGANVVLVTFADAKASSSSSRNSNNCTNAAAVEAFDSQPN